ncbi:MAG: hypothetical protein DMG23_06910 [Acidobacteria bacterium]|nr:MAG: hypothetical protein DMG23_06910 [Acidobacteriota bacterium]
MKKTYLLLALCCACSSPAFGRKDNYESFLIEFTPSYWLVNSSGKAQSGSDSVDLRSDLGVRKNTSEFLGKVTLKPFRKHRLVFEGVPFRFSGRNNLNRTFTFAGQTYMVQDQITFKAQINYLFGGYQYDVVSLRHGHFGIVTGVAYFDARGTITSSASGTSSSDRVQVPLPLLGAEFRAFPMRASNRININGELKGMSFGRYGSYFQSALNAGLSFGRHVTFQAGFALQDLDVRDDTRTKTFNTRFAGPVFSIQFRE